MGKNRANPTCEWKAVWTGRGKWQREKLKLIFFFFFLLEWKWKWEYKVLFFNPPNTRKHLKNLPWCFWKQHIQNASRLLITAKPRESKLTDIPPYCWKILKPKFRVPCSLVKGKLVKSDLWLSQHITLFKKILKSVTRGMFDTILLIINFSGKI